MAEELPKGELCISSLQTKSDFVTLEHLTDKAIINISASEKKMFVIFEDTNGEKKMTPLHAPEVDELDSTFTENTVMSHTGDLQYRAVDLYSKVGNISDIKCSKSMTLLRNDKAQTYIFGYGNLGALGCGVRSVCSEPKLIKKLENVPVKSIAVGDSHCLALSTFGDMYSWGRGIEGQLGQKNFQVTAYPTRCSFFDNLDAKQMKDFIKTVPIETLSEDDQNGPSNFQVVPEKSEYIRGKSQDLNLKTLSKPTSFKAIENEPPNNVLTSKLPPAQNGRSKSFVEKSWFPLSVSTEVCDWKHQASVNFAVTPTADCRPVDPKIIFKEDVERAACNRYEEKNSKRTKEEELFETIQMQYSPERLLQLDRIKVDVLYATGNHSFALTNFRTLYGWGENLCGQLGLPIKTGYPTPELIKIKELVLELSCQKTHTLLITTNLNLYSAGLNNYYQTGLGPDKHYTPFKRIENDLDGNPLPKIKAAATTSCYSIAVSLSNQIYCWGCCFLDSNPKNMYPRKKVFPGMRDIISVHAINSTILVFRRPSEHHDESYNTDQLEVTKPLTYPKRNDFVKKVDEDLKRKTEENGLAIKLTNTDVYPMDTPTSRAPSQQSSMGKSEKASQLPEDPDAKSIKASILNAN